MSDDTSGQIDNVMQEDRLFPPSSEFSAKAGISSMEQYQVLYDAAKNDPDKFWGDIAREELHWFEPFQTVHEMKDNVAQWFVGGKTNVSYNCLDANIAAGNGDRKAIIWEGEPGDQRTLTYSELHKEVCRFANALKSLGCEQGDVVSIYMPMTPELAIAMLACARIGAIHSVIFAGFSAEAIADRNNDASAKIQLTSDGLFRRGKTLPLKQTVDEALTKSPTVEKCIVLRRAENAIEMTEGRDYWWHELVEQASDDCPAEPLDSETDLFILYTSGSTGKPKGILHTTAGQLVGQEDLSMGIRLARRGYLLVHRRLRLDHWSQLYRLWSDGQWSNGTHVRGCPQPSGSEPILGHCRASQSHDSLHRADRDQGVREVG